MKTVNSLIANILNIDLAEFEVFLGRGMKPVKAAVRLGADLMVAQIIAGLKLATTAEEINTVYASNILSCMKDQPVGEFWEYNNVQCLYTSNFRILCQWERGALFPKAYGFHHEVGRELLLPFMGESVEPCLNRHQEKEFIAPYGKVVYIPYNDLDFLGRDPNEIAWEDYTGNDFENTEGYYLGREGTEHVSEIEFLTEGLDNPIPKKKKEVDWDDLPF